MKQIMYVSILITAISLLVLLATIIKLIVLINRKKDKPNNTTQIGFNYGTIVQTNEKEKHI